MAYPHNTDNRKETDLNHSSVAFNKSPFVTMLKEQKWIWGFFWGKHAKH